MLAGLLLLGGSVLAGTGGVEEDYTWPLAYQGCLTSSFAEYRQGHFHAGIDLSTGGKTGFKVRAIADGEVYRVRTSPHGYGKVIYIAFPDGRIAVYAHLSDFALHIREVVEREQQREGRYAVDIRLPSGAIPVSAGEVIGFSGQTGVGAPHLHFELRDGEDVPLNPLRHGFSIDDATAPVIRSVVLTPLESDSRVDWSIRPVTIDLEWSDGEGCYRTNRTVRVVGPVGVLIHCDDRQSSCDRRLGVYSLDLRVDEEVAYRSRFDRFSYDKARLVGIEFDQGRIERGGSRYHRLFTTATNLLPFTLTDRRHAGVIVGSGRREYGEGMVLTEGLHMLEAVASDASGNGARAVLAVLVGPLPEVRRARVTEDDEVTVFMDGSPGEIGDFLVSRSLNGGRQWETRKARYEIDRGAWVANGFPELPQKNKSLLFRIDVATLEGAHRKPLFLHRNYEAIPTPEPVMDLSIEYHADAVLIRLEVDRVYPYRVETRVIRDGRSPIRPEMHQVDANLYEGVVVLDDLESEPAWVTVTIRGKGDLEWSSLEEIRAVRVQALTGGEVTHKEGMATLRLGRAALVKDTHFRIEKEDGPELERGLTYISPVYRFEPGDALLREEAEIAIRPFVDSGEGKRVALYRMDAHGRWRYESRRVDPDLPEITTHTRSLSRYALIRDDAPPSVFGLRPEEGTVVNTRKPRLQAKITDVGSGFEDEDIRILLDGKRVIAEWDPERNFIFYAPARYLDVGSHRVTVIASDRAGNSVRKEATFYISGE